MRYITEDVKKMAELLRQGYTMLNLSCPVCKNPIFRNKKGERFCPICNRKVIMLEEMKANQNKSAKTSDTSHQEIKSEMIFSDFDNSDKLDSLEKIIYNNIDIFTNKLQNETEIDLIDKYIGIILKLIEIILRLKKLK